MSAEDMVDAALAGFDQGKFVTIPALGMRGQWEYEAAHQALMPNLSRPRGGLRHISCCVSTWAKTIRECEIGGVS